MLNIFHVIAHNRVLNVKIVKLWDLMRLFRKSVMKNAYLPKINILLQLGVIYSMQTFLYLPWFQLYRTKSR